MRLDGKGGGGFLFLGRLDGAPAGRAPCLQQKSLVGHLENRWSNLGLNLRHRR
jgi:hypothetical protein